MKGITKKFGNFVANNQIDLTLKKGEIHALLGENGAGKSTLMNILSGLLEPTEGEIKVNGVPTKIDSPNTANRLKIGMVHQHFMLVKKFSVVENIILGKEQTKFGFIDKNAVKEEIMELSKKYHLAVDPDAKVEDITVGMEQRVEILKTLYRGADILIFDEPTAVLTPQEIEELMQIMKSLAKEGKSILFITHKLNEIMQVADRCSVLRKGAYIGTVDVKNTTKEELSNMMVGRDVKFVVDKKESNPTEEVLELENLCVFDKIHKKDSIHDVSFKVRKGEIVCIAGIDGNGQTELVHAITGLEKIKSGKVKLNIDGEMRDVSHTSIRYKNTHGISHIPEDRHKHGLILDYTLEQNLVLQRYLEPEFQSHGMIRFKEVRKYAERLIQEYDVRSGQGPITISRSMSGGNQQKAIIARELDRKHNLLIAVQPTRGLDVGAIEYIHKQIIQSRDSGAGVLLVSLELDEVMNLSDRILVMYEGEIVGELDPKKTTVQELGLYMAGAKRNGKEEKSDEK